MPFESLKIALLATCSVLVGSCGNTDNALNTRKGERVLVGWLDKQDLHPDSVECPSGIKMVHGTVFVCKATIANSDSMVLDIQIEVVSETGDVNYKYLTEKVVSLHVERALRGEIKDQTGVNTKIDCGLRVRPAVPGNTFTCTSKDVDSKSDEEKLFQITMIAEAPFWTAKRIAGEPQSKTTPELQ